MRRFVEVCERKGLKVNTSKRKVMVLNGKEGLECEVYVDGIRLEHVSEFKYFICVLDESGTDGTECSREMASGKRVAGTIRSLANARDLQLEDARVLHEALLVPVLMYGSETVLWLEKGISRIKTVQMDNLRNLLSIRRMDRVPNERVRKFFGVAKEVDERIDEGALRWFEYVEKIENYRIAKRAYVGERVGIRSVGRPRKRWIDIVKYCLKKRGLNIRQARRMVHDSNKWWRFVRGNP